MQVYVLARVYTHNFALCGSLCVLAAHLVLSGLAPNGPKGRARPHGGTPAPSPKTLPILFYARAVAVSPL